MSRIMRKPAKRASRSAKTQISLGIRPVWSEYSLSAWRKAGSLANHWALSEDSDQTEWMSRLIWVSAGRTVILLVLSWGGSNACCSFPREKPSDYTSAVLAAILSPGCVCVLGGGGVVSRVWTWYRRAAGPPHNHPINVYWNMEKSIPINV